jgi:hypothetical protein
LDPGSEIVDMALRGHFILIEDLVMKNKIQGSISEFGSGKAELVELVDSEIAQVSGGGRSGFDAALAIMAVVAFGSLFTPIGPITAGIAIGSSGGIAGAQFLSNTFYFGGGGGRRRGRRMTNPA